MKSLLDCWSEQVRRQPIAPALIDAASGDTHTFRDLDNAAHTLDEAENLSRLRPGETVVLVQPNGAAWIAAFLALQRRGVAVLPLDADQPDATVAEVAANARAVKVLGRSVALPASEKPLRRRTPVTLIKATSGTTGRPRLFPFTDAQLRADGEHIIAAMGLRPDDRNLALIPFGHSYGFGNLILPLILAGIPIVCGRSFFPEDIRADALRHRATIFPGVPALIRALADSPTPTPLPPSLRLVISAGSALSPELAQRFASSTGRRVHNFYGSSETGGIAFDPTGDATLSGQSVGHPLTGVDVAIDPRTGRLRISGAAVWNAKSANPHPGSFLLPDKARLLPSGEVVLLGRTDRQVKIGGRRISLREVERTLSALPGVDQAWVSLLPRANGEWRLGAVLATTLDPATCQRALRAALPPWKRPARLLTLAALPLTARGKIDTSRLQSLLSKNKEPP